MAGNQAGDQGGGGGAAARPGPARPGEARVNNAKAVLETVKAELKDA